MFTSRAEHRLVLRQDNADLRLTPLAHELGLVDAGRWEKLEAKRRDLGRLREHVASAAFEGVKIAQWLRRPDNTFQSLPEALRAGFHPELWENVEVDVKYAGYIARQEVAIEKLRRSEEKHIPPRIDYQTISGLRVEARQKLDRIRPETLGHAARISGITPADLALLAVYVSRPGR